MHVEFNRGNKTNEARPGVEDKCFGDPRDDGMTVWIASRLVPDLARLAKDPPRNIRSISAFPGL